MNNLMQDPNIPLERKTVEQLETIHRLKNELAAKDAELHTVMQIINQYPAIAAEIGSAISLPASFPADPKYDAWRATFPSTEHAARQAYHRAATLSKALDRFMGVEDLLKQVRNHWIEFSPEADRILKQMGVS